MIHSIAAPVHRLRCACAALVVAIMLAACVTTPAPQKPTPPPVALPATFVRVAWTDLPGFALDRVSEAWPAFRIGCRALVADTASPWRKPCAAAEAIDGRDEAQVRAFLSVHFSPYAVAFPDGSASGLVTGYYEPRLAGSRTRTPRYGVPIHAPPDDLLVIELAELHPELKGRRVRGRVEGRRVLPYWTRNEIEAGRAALAGKALAYVADPLDAFFLQVQGSGRIALDDGSVMRVGYADQNGHPYRSIGRVLVERGELALERSSMQAIRDWAHRNPGMLAALLDENPSYVFFREIPPPAPGTLDASIDGPIGALGVPLLARRTVAVDPQAIPLGAPLWLATTYPATERALERLVLAQDTGGAIRGAVRADFFWGHGNEAGREAGRMRQQGRLWILWPAELPPPVSPTP